MSPASLLGPLLAGVMSAALGCGAPMGGATTCEGASDCDDGEVCRDGVCTEDGRGLDGSIQDAGASSRDGSSRTEDAGRGDVEECDDGLDGDADGRVDEECVCEEETSQSCWLGDPARRGHGVCTDGVQTCSGGVEFQRWGACVGQTDPDEEAERTCADGVDHDCDGLTDCDDPDCLGRVCDDMEHVCAESGACSTCEPRDELCNDVDDDCDGRVDEAVTRGCGAGGAGCTAGTETCTAGVWGACEGAGGSGAETCDGTDEDCDGAIDEDLVETCGSDVGECRSGTRACTAGAFGGCVGELPPRDEECNGADDDCDGRTDEGIATMSCGSDVGECVAGTRTCSGGVFGSCRGRVSPTAETCNGADDDCDGRTDEGVASMTCGSDTGRCRTGTRTCSGGGFGGCTGEVAPRAERCDGVDDDCDGRTDEGITTPESSACDGDDDDCDGYIDEYPCTNCTQIVRVSGLDRYGTAVDQSRKLFPATAGTAVVVGVDGSETIPNPDGVVAGSLAFRNNGPVLLTPRSGGLHPDTRSELLRLRVSRVYILGGTGSVSAATESELRSFVTTVTRIAGANRFASAADVARRVGVSSTARRVFIVNGSSGSSFADAAAVAGLAGRLRYPILFVTRDTVPTETSGALGAMGISRAYVIGGTGAVSASVMSSLPSPVRLSGASRVTTALAVANYAVSTWGVSPDTVSLINQSFSVDAMTAAAAGNIHLFADRSSIPSETLSFLTTHKPDEGWLMGGRARFDTSMEGSFCSAVSH